MKIRAGLSLPYSRYTFALVRVRNAIIELSQANATVFCPKREHIVSASSRYSSVVDVLLTLDLTEIGQHPHGQLFGSIFLRHEDTLKPLLPRRGCHGKTPAHPTRPSRDNSPTTSALFPHFRRAGDRRDQHPHGDRQIVGPGLSLRTVAGARLTVMRLRGKNSPAFLIAGTDARGFLAPPHLASRR